jgi:hypothetical protein
MVKIELVVIRQLKELSELPANTLDRLSSLGLQFVLWLDSPNY